MAKSSYSISAMVLGRRLRAFIRLLHLLRIGGDLDAGALLLEQHHHARVASLPTSVTRLPHLGIGEVADPHRHAELASQFGCELDVLGGELEREIRRIVFAGQELVEQAVEGETAATDALAHGCP